MIDIRRLEILREVDRCGTVVAAAAAVHLTPSAVSQQLAALSREVGVPMLEPDGRRVRLTEPARILLGHAHEIFTRLENAESDLAAFKLGDNGTVRLGAFPSAVRAVAVPVLDRLADRALRVEVREIDPDHSVDALLGRRVDVMITLTGGELYLGQDDARVSTVHLFDDVLDLVLPVGHRLAGKDRVDLADLRDEDWIVNLPGTPCFEVTHAACAARGYQPRARHFADEFIGTLALVAAGAGVALLPRLAHDGMAGPGVVVRRTDEPTPIRRIGAQLRAGTAGQPHIAPLLRVLRQIGAELHRRDLPDPRRPTAVPVG